MKRARKLLVGLMAVVMLFGMSMTTFAAPPAGSVAPVKAFGQITEIGSTKSVSSVTIYTNDAAQGEKTLNVSYTWDDKLGEQAPEGMKVSTNNRAVVTVEPALFDVKESGVNKTVHTYVGSMKLKAVGNGQATVTIKSSDGKKGKTLKVTVKTYADDITFDENVVKNVNGELTVEIANKKGSTLNLGAAAVTKDGAASDAKVKYSVSEKEASNAVTVDKNGNVKVTRNANAGNEAKISVVSNDKNITRDITVKLVEPKVAANGQIAFGTNVPANKKISLKTNKTAAYAEEHTFSLTLQNPGVADLSQNFLFKSNKPNIATVDAKGKITAVGNGSAKITVTPKLGNKASATVTVSVTTDVETVSVSKKEFTILANGKDIAQIGGATNANASKSAVAYELSSLKGWNKETGKFDIDVNLGVRKDVAKYITLDAKKGTVKAKAECQAVIRAYAVNDNTKDKTVTVTAVTPVKTFDVTSDSLQAAIRKNKVTIYRLGVDEDGNVMQNPLTLKTNMTAPNGDVIHGEMAETEKVTWTSNKPAVATVVADEDGNYHVKANGNGTAVLTATAKDGSKATKKITVTVKTNAYDITIAKAQPSANIIPGADAAVGPTQEDDIESQNVVYVVGNSTRETSYNLASVIKAVTNSDASTKTVKYYTREKNNADGYAIYGEEIKAMKMRSGETKEIYVVAGVNNAAMDVDKYGNLVTAGEEKEVKVTLACIDESNVPSSANDYQVVFTGKYAADADGTAPDVLLKAGATDMLAAKGVLADGITGKVALDATAITWKSGNTKVVTVGKDGKLTAKKPGIAKITATYKFEYYENGRKKNGTVTGERTVYVGRSDKDVLAQVNKSVDITLKAENRDWTGVTSKFNSKNNTFALDIIQPNNQLSNMKNSGFATALKEIANGSNLKYSYAAISDNLNGGGWELQEKAGTIGQFEIRQKGSAAWEGSYSFADAVQTIFNSLSDTNEQDALKYWNGKEYTVRLGIGETPIDAKNNQLADGRWFDYEVSYTVTTTMAANVYDRFIDGEMAAAVEKLNSDASAEQVGLEGIKFNSAANEFEVTVSPDKTIDELMDPENTDSTSAKNSAAQALATVLEDAKAVTLNIDAKNSEDAYKYNGTVTKVRESGESVADLIDGLLTGYFDQIKKYGVTTLGDLAGSIIKADVTFEDGNMTYTQSYRLYLFAGKGKFTDKVADSSADEVIAKAVSENAEQDFATAAYDADTNTLTVGLKDGIAEMTPQAFKEEYDTQANRDKAKQVLNDMYKAFTYDVREVKVTFNGKTETVTQSEITDAVNNENSAVHERIVNLIKENVNTIRDLTEKDIAVEVLYAQSVASDAETVSVLYTVKVTAPAAQTSDAIEEETTEEETMEETTTEEETTEEESTEEVTTEEEIIEEESTEEETTEEETTEETSEEDSIEEETTEETTEEDATDEETMEESSTEEVMTETSTEAETTVETTNAE